MKLGFKKKLLKASQSFSATNGMFLWRHSDKCVSQTAISLGTFTEPWRWLSRSKAAMSRACPTGKMRAFSAMGTCFKSQREIQREIQRCTMLFVRDVAKKLN